MKVYLLPQSGNFYKANLHSHSTFSDGKWTVQQIKERYMANGYSIVAFTDHQVFINHNYLTDDKFLALNGYEIDIAEIKPLKPRTKTCHFCLIALDRDRTLQRLYCESRFIDGNPDWTDVSKDDEPFNTTYDTASISDIMQRAKDDGFFVTYNHPAWSMEFKDEYLAYDGMHAMEIVNYSSYITGHDEHNTKLYDNMLHSGKRIFCIAADDNHNAFPEEHPKCDSFGGFTMIKADELSYEAVTSALVNGNFYASEGPEIYDLYYDTDDDSIHISTSDAVLIHMTAGERDGRTLTADRKGMTINEAVFKLDKTDEQYVRFVVRDRVGNHAYTSAYWVADIRK